MTRFIQAGGHRLAYSWINPAADRQEPVIVFLHEGLGCMKQWKDFPSLLCKATGLRGLMYDRYGYGESEALKEPRDANFLKREACEVLPEILNQLDISGKVILFGHSDGGTIALFFASCFPEKTLCLITEAPHVFLEEVSLGGILSAVKAYKESDLKQKLAKYHGDKTQAMFESWTGLWLDEKNRDWNMFEELKRIESPLLVIQGDKDNYGSFRQVEIILELTKGKSDGFFLKNCGHFPHYEHKNTVLNESARFFHSSL